MTWTGEVEGGRGEGEKGEREARGEGGEGRGGGGEGEGGEGGEGTHVSHSHDILKGRGGSVGVHMMGKKRREGGRG